MRVEWARGDCDEQDAEGLARGAMPGKPAGAVTRFRPAGTRSGALPWAMGSRRLATWWRWSAAACRSWRFLSPPQGLA
jgi:hypothetical protein